MKYIKMIAIAVMFAGIGGVVYFNASQPPAPQEGQVKTIRVAQPAAGGQEIQYVNETLNLSDEDPIGLISFSDLIEAKREANLPYIIARVQTDNGYHRYYDAHALNNYLFGILGRAPFKEISEYADIHRVPIARIDYFIINEPIAESALRTQEFRHWCSFDDLVAHTPRWSAEFYANEPAPVVQPLTPAEMLERAHQLYDGFNEEHEEVEPDYVRAFADFQSVADQTEDPQAAAEAANMLGAMYREGHGVAQNYPQAVAYYRQAAAQVYDVYAAMESLENLGDMYRLGEGVVQDYEQAADYYNQVIARADDAAIPEDGAEAQIKLGDMYYDGEGFPQSYAQAREHYEQAAEQNAALQDMDFNAASTAQLKLGKMYYNAEGVQKDDARALEYFRLALLGNPHMNMDDEVRREAMEYFVRLDPVAAAQAQLEISRRYADFLMFDKTLEYLESAANQRADIEIAIKALIQLGNMYYSGQQGFDGQEVVAQDYQQALAYRNQAVDLADQHGLSELAAPVHVTLGDMYNYGEGINQNRVQALAHYERAAGQNNDPQAAVHGKYGLGWLYYLNGIGGIAEDYAKARRFFEDVVNSPDAIAWQKPVAQQYLGKMYYEGWGGPVNRDQARIYFEQVVNNPDASDYDKQEARAYLSRQ